MDLKTFILLRTITTALFILIIIGWVLNNPKIPILLTLMAVIGLFSLLIVDVCWFHVAESLIGKRWKK